MRRRSLTIYTISHFIVDFACFFILFGRFTQSAGPTSAGLGFLVYNVIAFGLQPVFGYICDRRKGLPAGALGCFLVAAAVIPILGVWAQLAAAALGNALFHVGGGINNLSSSDGRMGASGIFVSSGGLGVALGTLAASYAGPSAYLCLAVTAAVSVCGVLTASIRPLSSESGYEPRAFIPAVNAKGFYAVIALCFISIFVRAYVGGSVPMGFKTGALMAVLVACAASLGKALGGFAADRFGARLTGAVTLLASAPLLCLFHDSAYLCALGLMLFNMSMPITLCGIASKLPRNPGLAFGLSTLALLLGSAPLFFFVVEGPARIIVMAALTLLSAGCLYAACSPSASRCAYSAHCEVKGHAAFR